jgi:nitronate monooxygenase/enoyl-[acyl-carrier protein] reductase II
MGTRFLASTDVHASVAYKERVVSAKAEDAIHLEQFDVGWSNAPHRVLRNASVARWESAGRPASGQRPGEGVLLGTMQSGGSTIDIPAYSAYLPEPDVTADVEQMALYAGQSCSLIDAVQPAAEIVAQVVRDAADAMERIKVWRGL